MCSSSLKWSWGIFLELSIRICRLVKFRLALEANLELFSYALIIVFSFLMWLVSLSEDNWTFKSKIRPDGRKYFKINFLSETLLRFHSWKQSNLWRCTFLNQTTPEQNQVIPFMQQKSTDLCQEKPAEPPRAASYLCQLLHQLVAPAPVPAGVGAVLLRFHGCPTPSAPLLLFLASPVHGSAFLERTMLSGLSKPKAAGGLCFQVKMDLV